MTTDTEGTPVAELGALYSFLLGKGLGGIAACIPRAITAHQQPVEQARRHRPNPVQERPHHD